MSNLLNKNLITFLLISLFHILLLNFLHGILFPVHLAYHNFLFFDLISKYTNLSYASLVILDIANLLLLYLVGKRTLGQNFPLILVAVYSICPWVLYLVVAESFYIYLLFLVLLGFYGIVL